MKKYLVIAFMLFLEGCASYSHKKDAFHQQFNVGNFEAASTVMYSSTAKEKATNTESEKQMSEGKPLPSDFSDLGNMKFFIGLNSGTAAMYSQDYALSDVMFDIASDSIAKEETDGYSPKYYEKVMLHTYRALALLQSGDIDNARVEFNRADASQGEAAQENKKEISKLKKEAAEEKFTGSMEAANKVLGEEFKEFDNFKPYADFVNPYTTYMNGLFLSLHGSRSDIENGILNLKRAKSMSPNNKFIKSDIQMAENLANSKKSPATVWVVYENGLIAEIEKQHFAIPFVINHRVKLAHMALPKMVPLASAYPSIQIASNNKKISTQNIVDMDRVMKTEFKNRYPAEVTKAVIWMTLNLIAQEVTQQAIGDDNQLMGDIAALAIGSVSNPVETRTWSSLPKDIQIARFAMPKNRKIQILDNTGKEISQEIEINKDINQALVVVRIPTLNAKPGISVTKLK
jgi:hypothetical protein